MSDDTWEKRNGASHVRNCYETESQRIEIMDDEKSLSVEIMLPSGDTFAYAYPPLAAIADLLREAGWTVTPPGGPTSEALGLVEPDGLEGLRAISEVIPCQPDNPEVIVLAPKVQAATFDVAVAAELRRLADDEDRFAAEAIAHRQSTQCEDDSYQDGVADSSRDSASRLRRRADELDPP